MPLPKELEAELNKIDKSTPLTITPDWVVTNDNGSTRVSVPKLGDELILEHPLMITKDFPNGVIYNGLYWDEVNKDSLKRILGSATTDKLVAVGKYSQRVKNAVVDYISDMSYKNEISPFQTPTPELISFKNGDFNIHTGQLMPHSKDNYILGGLPYDLDISGKETPYIDSLIDYMIGNEQRNFLIEYIGYMFYKSYAPFNIFVIMKGIAGNGKSTLINTIINPLLTTVNISNLSLEQLTTNGDGGKFYSSQLLGKLANIFMDLQDTYIQNPALMKSLTGADGTDAQRKHGQNFTFVNYAKFFFGANDLPTMRHDDGIIDRATVLPTIAPKVRNDPQEKLLRATLFPNDEIKKELPAFAFKAMSLFNEARKRGVLSITEPMNKETKAWSKSDPLSRFLDECTIPCNEDSGISVNYLWTHYKNWLADEGYKSELFKKNTLTQELEKRGFKKRRLRYGSDDNGIQKWRYVGLDLNDNA